MTTQLELLVLGGSPREMAELQGRHFREQVPEMLAALADLPLLPRALGHRGRLFATRIAARALGAFYLRAHAPLLRTHRDGRYRDYFDALASGLGESLTTVYGVNAFEIESALPSVRMGCTALAFSPSLMRHGRPLLAYNHDFPPAFEPYLFVRRNRPRGAFESLSVGYPTIAGAILGVNAEGLGVSVNQAFATDASRREPALLTTLLVQDLLDECASVADARAACSGRRLATGAILTLVDARGERAVVELSARRSAVRTAPDDQVLHAFNQYLEPSMLPREVPVGAITVGIGGGYDVHRCNLTREARLGELTPRRSVYQLDDVCGLVSDHDGGGGTLDTICVHGDEMNATILSALVDPVERSLQVARGHACTARYERHALENSQPRAEAELVRS